MNVINLVFIVIFIMLDRAEAFHDRRPGSLATLTGHRQHKPQNGVGSGDSGVILFPTDPPEYTSRFSPTRVQKCDGSTFCEDPDDYPTERIKKTIEKNLNAVRFFNSSDEGPQIDQRILVTDPFLCSANVRVTLPRTAQNMETQEWHLVVNVEGFEQGVLVEECSSKGESKCETLTGFPEGYKSNCKQKYHSRQLLGVLENDTLITFKSAFASSCCCQVLFTGNVVERFGVKPQSSSLTTSASSSPSPLVERGNQSSSKN